MNAYQRQLLSRANSALIQLELLVTLANHTDNDHLRTYTVSDFVALLESPLNELSSCLCNEALDEVL